MKKHLFGPLVSPHSIDLFWEKVEKRGAEDCWNWTAGLTHKGYGHFGIYHNGKRLTVTAHRLSYAIHSGECPPDICVCHSCDNRRCVNPAHLWLGTHRDNARDRDSKGRRRPPAGELNGFAKLTSDVVHQIRMDARSQSRIADDYGIHQTTVSRIKRNASWSHVGGAAG